MNSTGAKQLDIGRDLGTDPLLKSPKQELYAGFDNKGPWYTTGEAYTQLLNAAGLCSLYSLNFAVPLVELLAPMTGWDMDWEEGLQAGKRIMTLTQAFTVREGITPDTFAMPRRFMTPLSVGPASGVMVDFDAMKQSWFKAMDWDINTGKPGDRIISELELGDVIGA